MSKSARFYRKLLLLYPKPYRDRYGEAMLQTFLDSRADSEDGDHSRFWWLAVIVDVVRSATSQQLAYAGQTDGLFDPQTRPYSLVALLLILPAFVFFAAGTIFQFGFPQAFAAYRGALYHPPVVILALVVLPAVALSVSALCLDEAIANQKPVFQWKRAIPLLIVVMSIVSILFLPLHDAGPCALHLLNHSLPQTLHCLRSS